ncbi:MAG: 6,7-dimethyl-8-ribityllumazine synthase [Saprospiraceae bacterium]|nr:6,7-dimethyl-8-ribityllumazine synthase [Saprospiraceae bacterium]
MATHLNNLSEYDTNELPSAEGMRFGIIVSEWNTEITHALAEGAIQTLKDNGANEEDIIIKHVPGSFELTLGAQLMIDYIDIDAVICLGCVIQGETKHFDFICNAVSNGISQVGLDNGIPVIFGVLTTDNLQQAKDRSGGKHGNKGVEAAITAMKMINLEDELFNETDFLDDEFGNNEL